MKNRDIEREWRRIARKEFLDGVVVPLVGLCFGASLIYMGMIYWPHIFVPIGAAFSAIGIPLMMWLNKK